MDYEEYEPKSATGDLSTAAAWAEVVLVSAILNLSEGLSSAWLELEDHSEPEGNGTGRDTLCRQPQKEER